MRTNSLFVWQVRVWLMALAVVLVFANARQPAADQGRQHLAADREACLGARGPILQARLTTAHRLAAAKKCREAKVVEGTSLPAQAVGG